jgi:Icc-related predicted phosphoesterase
MKRIAWLSDIHLDFLSSKKLDRFINLLSDSSPDHVWISGDIGQSKTVIEFLKLIETSLKCSVFFVLGNHDFYEGSISELRNGIQDFCSSSKRLLWLSDSGVVEVSSDIGLIGHDSWADGRLGDYVNSELLLNDYLLISEFNPLIGKTNRGSQSYPAGIKNIYNSFLSIEAKQKRLSIMQAFASEAHEHVEKHLSGALEKYRQMFFITHVPPFMEACLHQGKISDGSGLPHFSCKIVGESLIKIMNKYPNRHLTVLCGHTHSRAEVQVLDNLTVLAAEAMYGSPVIQRILQF